jgi:hypothetical protein
MSRYSALLCVFMAVWLPLSSFANQPSYEHEVKQIPKKPSTPPTLTQKAPKQIPHCERYYLYLGKRLECDSNLGRDGENLRAIMHDVPSAIAELDIYQDNLKKVQYAAYFGTGGLLTVVGGALISRPPVDPSSGALKPGGYIMLAGAVVILNSLLYGLSLVKTNESHLSNAVNYYNSAHPERPIELQFSTQVNF